MKLRNPFNRKRNPPRPMVARRLSKLPPPPPQVTQPILLARGHNPRHYGPASYGRAVDNFYQWAHVHGYTYQDAYDYLNYLLNGR